MSPCLEGHAHKLTHGRLGHRYFGALIDGLHYTEDTKDKFAGNFLKTIYRNIHATCN